MFSIIFLGSLLPLEVYRAPLKRDLNFRNVYFVEGVFEYHTKTPKDLVEKLPDKLRGNCPFEVGGNTSKYAVFKILKSFDATVDLKNLHFVFPYSSQSFARFESYNSRYIRLDPDFDEYDKARIWIRREGDRLVAITDRDMQGKIMPFYDRFPFRQKPLERWRHVETWPYYEWSKTVQTLDDEFIQKNSDFGKLSPSDTLPAVWRASMIAKYSRDFDYRAFYKYITARPLNFDELMLYDLAFKHRYGPDWNDYRDRYSLFKRNIHHDYSEAESRELLSFLRTDTSYAFMEMVFREVLTHPKSRQQVFGQILQDPASFDQLATKARILLRTRPRYEEFLKELQKSGYKDVSRSATDALGKFREGSARPLENP